MKKLIIWIVSLSIVIAGLSPSAQGDGHQDSSAPCGPSNGEFSAWTKKLQSGTEVKFYAKYPQVGQKIQFMLQQAGGDYKEIAWLRVEENDLGPEGNYNNLQNEIYFIRTVKLEPGKNRFRILLNGEPVNRTITYVPNATGVEDAKPGVEYERGYFCDLGGSNEEQSAQEKSGAISSVIPGEAPYNLFGAAQKGPLVFGSRVWVTELDDNLTSNGRTFLTQIDDYTGTFSIESQIDSSLVEIVASGYYFDEISGGLSGAPITLSAIADLSVDTTPTVNVLTTLQAPRLRNLIRQGSSYEQAQQQATSELLAVFGISPEDIRDFSALHAMSLAGENDQDSVLLATTSLVSQVASSKAAQSSSSQAAEISLLLSEISADLASDGVVENSRVFGDLAAAASSVSLDVVRNNLETYFSNRGVSLSTPKFEEWIDKDNSGTLPQRRSFVEGVSLPTLANQGAYQPVTSDVIRISGLQEGESVQVSVSPGSQLNKNGVTISGLYTTASNGDDLIVLTTSPGPDETKTVELLVGSSLTEWAVKTKPVEAVSQPSSLLSCGLGSGPNAKFFAARLRTPDTGENFELDYAGLAVFPEWNNGNTANIAQISVHRDLNGTPGAALGTARTTTSPGTRAYLDPMDLSYCASSAKQQGYFESLTLDANELFWVVVEFDKSTFVRTRVFYRGNDSVISEHMSAYSADGSTWNGGSSNWVISSFMAG